MVKHHFNVASVASTDVSVLPSLKKNLPPLADITVANSKEGFSPTKIVVKRGQAVTFTNSSEEDFQPVSNPHPTHDLYPEFSSTTPIHTGNSYKFTFNKIGIWGYHDELNPEHKGTVIVD